jgi:hypothetical protein
MQHLTEAHKDIRKERGNQWHERNRAREKAIKERKERGKI